MTAGMIVTRGDGDKRDGRVELCVIGMAGRFPGARDVSGFWKNLLAGHDSLRHFSHAELQAKGVAEEVWQRKWQRRSRGEEEEEEEGEEGGQPL